MENEIELKLRVAPDAANRVLRTPALRGLREGRSRSRRLTSVYFDTPDCAFAARDMALRIRHSGRIRLQTVKGKLANGHGGSLQRHAEWTTEVSGDLPELHKIAEPKLREALFKRAARSGLDEVFRTMIERRTLPLLFDGTHIELAFDRGVVRSGEREEDICEVELELLEGDPERLYDLALLLAAELPLSVEHRTKSARGYHLYRGTAPEPVRAESVALAAGMTVWEAFVAIARNCLTQLQANEMPVLAGEDPEGVHQARVAVRRLRAALSAFESVLAAEELQLFAAELRWLQQCLGSARDWDVLIGETLDPLAAEIGHNGGLGELLARAGAEREAAYRVARDVLRTERYAALQLRLERWFDGPRSDLAAGPLPPFSAQVLDRYDKKLSRSGRRLAELPENELHAVRIKAKKARYAAEFFRGLFDKKAARRYIASVRGIQDHLGALNDAAVARSLMVEARLGELPGQALLDGWFAHAIVQGKSGLDPIWKNYRAARGYWR
jgi:triphosphatase